MRRCPACPDVLMHTFADSTSGLEIDSCPECFGLWFDSEELKRFFESPDLSGRILEEESALSQLGGPKDQPDSKDRLCPACREILFCSRLGQVHVDYCLGCRGIWLDRFEMDTLVQAFLAGERGNLLIVNQLGEGLGTPSRPNPKAQDFLRALERYRRTWDATLPQGSG